MHDNIDEPQQDLIQKIKANFDWYKNVEVSMVIIKEKDKNLLFHGKAVFIHKSDKNQKEVTYDYGHAILARRILNVDEFISLFNAELSDTLNIKDLTSIFVGKGFNSTVFQIPSNTQYVGTLFDWPIRVYDYGTDRNTNVNSSNDFLVKPGCPTFPNLREATNSFLGTTHDYFDNHLKGLYILVPDYRAKLKTIQISEKNIDVEIETKEIQIENLILKLNCKRDKEEFLPEDISITNNNISVEFPFQPKTMYLFLVDKNDGGIIDHIEYGNYNTERHKGITIKTSSGLIESLIIKGENKTVEFKREMSEEFLESVVSFANTTGGKIILGVNDRKNIVGIHEEFSNLEKKIRGTIRGRVEPQIEVNVESLEVQQSPLVIVTIREGQDKPYLVDGKAYMRINEADVTMSRVELDRIYQNRTSDRAEHRLGFRS